MLTAKAEFSLSPVTAGWGERPRVIPVHAPTSNPQQSPSLPPTLGQDRHTAGAEGAVEGAQGGGRARGGPPRPPRLPARPQTRPPHPPACPGRFQLPPRHPPRPQRGGSNAQGGQEGGAPRCAPPPCCAPRPRPPPSLFRAGARPGVGGPRQGVGPGPTSFLFYGLRLGGPGTPPATSRSSVGGERTLGRVGGAGRPSSLSVEKELSKPRRPSRRRRRTGGPHWCLGEEVGSLGRPGWAEPELGTHTGC